MALLASDGRWLQFNMIRNEELLSLPLAAMEAIELLADSRFSDMEALWIHRQLLAMNCKHVYSKTSDEWLEVFAAFDLHCESYRAGGGVLNDPQISQCHGRAAF